MRRITSLVLALVLLVGTVFAGTFTVSAESDLVASDDCITVLKRYEGFSKYPYWDVAQWTVGYGTRCPSDMLSYYSTNGITEAEAEVLLRNYVTAFGDDINYFADKYGITFSQNEFDALLLFSYNCGSGWVYSPSQNFHQSIANGKTGNELIYWFSRWCNANGINKALLRRRLCEANMYLNGEYSTTPPSNYCYVIYDTNGGDMDGRVQGYDANLPVDFAATPTYEGYVFQGWYTAKTGGARVAKLSASVNGMTLYAHWGTGPAGDDEEIYDPELVTVTADGVNIRKGPGTNYTVVGSYSRGEQVGITATQTVGDMTWGQCSKGWIALQYTTYGKTDAELPEDPETEETESVMGTVKANGGLTIRSGAGTGYSSVGIYSNGARVEILEQKTAGTMIWGKTDKGWISLSYVVLDEEETTPPADEDEEEGTVPPADEEEEEEDTTTSAVTGTVTGNDVRIRSGAGTSYGIVGYYDTGDKVTITEQKANGSMTWGKTAKGWISMNYVKLDSTADDSNTGSDTAEPQSVTGTVKVSDSLNVRSGPGTSYAIAGYLYNGNKVTITEQKTVGSITWGKTEKGWVSMAYIVLDSQEEEDKPQQTPDEDTDNDSSTESQSVTGTVRVNDYLSIRSGAGTSFGTVGYYYNGNKVTITEQKTVNGTAWGKTEKGWICLKYVVLDEEEQTTVKTIIADTLYVRSGAGTGYGIVGYVTYGTKVEILETKTVNGTTWGKISTGWISMDYAK